MKAPLRVLHLEDNSCDAELIRWALEKSKIPCVINQMSTRQEFEAAIQKGGIDIILSDSQLPSFDTLKALTRAREVCPDVPFVFVSGTASPILKTNAFFRGAADFIEKNDLSKLVSLLKRLFFSGEPQPANSSLPETGIPVMVQCKEFRCLGYLDRKGKWRNFNDSSELTDVISWLDL